MWFGPIYLVLIGVGGLCYPRRPRATGIVFMVLGASLLTAWTAGAISGNRDNILFAAASWIGLGGSFIRRFRTDARRRSHRAAWTGSAQ
jgi:hypothetical protein